MAQRTDAFDVEGLVEQRKELESLLMSNPAMEKKVQKIIRKVLLAARKSLSNEAKGIMKSDPRQAYKAVKTTVYRQILGGSVSILSKRRASKSGGSYEPPRHPSRRGGNRRKRSARTIDLQSYWGSDRGFILRFLEAGTKDRYIDHLQKIRRADGTYKFKWKTTGRDYGYRGRIKARNFFGNSSLLAMEDAAEDLTGYIDELIEEEFNKQ